VNQLESYTISREPLRLRFAHRHVPKRIVNTLFFGTTCLTIFAAAMAGWFGAVDMPHDGYVMAGTILALGVGLLCIWLGAMGVWGREEVAFQPDRIVVTRTLGPWRRSRELALVKGEHVVVAMDRMQFRGDPKAQEWLTASTDPLPPPVRIAMGFDLPNATLIALAEAITAAAERAGATTTFDRAPRFGEEKPAS